MASPDDQNTIGFPVPAGMSSVTARYDLLGEIGRGGMGVVFRARDRQTGDTVALKTLHPRIASDPELLGRFTNELLLARRITHKNVCRVHDLNDFGGVAVISMEFVAGRTLRDLLDEVESLSVRHGTKILRQVLAGLIEAHDQGVIHRDLKPENILIGRDGTVKIMDFGIARSIDAADTVTGLVVGTPAYMSPEQAAGKPPDTRSDVYALGLVIYEMFCGRPAFAGDSPVAIVAKQLHETPLSPQEIEPDLPARIERAIRKCLEKDPAKRFQSVRELEASLSDATPAPAERDAAPLPAHLARWQRSDALLLVGAVIALAIFFPFFLRTSLAPRSQVTFDRSVLWRIAQDQARRFGVQDRRAVDVGLGSEYWMYPLVAHHAGAVRARELANNPFPLVTWGVIFEGDFVEVVVNNRGELISFRREVVPGDPAQPPLSQARAIAEQAVQEFFGRRAADLEIERAAGDGPTAAFSWLDRRAVPGLRERFAVTIDARGIALAAKGYASHPGETFRDTTPQQWGAPMSFVIGVIMSAVGLLQRRRVDLAARWRMGLGGLLFAAGFVWSATFYTEGLLVNIGFGLMLALGVVLMSVATERLIVRDDGVRLRTLVNLFRWPSIPESSGLSILRGTLVGLLLLGLDTFLVWVAITYGGARLDRIAHVSMLGWALNQAAAAIAVPPMYGLMQSALLGLIAAFVISAIATAVKNPALRIVLPAALLSASGVHLSLGAVQPWYRVLALLLVDFLVLVLAFRAYDLLTLLVALFTAAFVWAAYAAYVMQQLIGPVQPLVVLSLWGLGVAAAAGVAFNRPLRTAYRRVIQPT